MKFLGFAALMAGMFVLNLCVPYGYFINMGIIAVALWNLV